ncbi:hypothetical protein [Sphingomonas sp. PAMC 26617]|uniref:hypothetical protein n=1 Tax=Sphingomonas sp. PAMC 26617 TaxID=1112216 RepID=UPI0012F52365|nr:hypothetical protein [Sphingomonas sp. PAMC 26617]
MGEQTWIYVPEKGASDDSERADWTGRIWSEGEQTVRWQFEVIRLTEPRTIYDQGVFQGALPVSVLVDHQRPATLVRPIAFLVDPGKSGTKHPYLRTRLTGSFQALLTGRAVADENEPIFVGMGMESETFAAWYGGRSFDDTVGEDHRTTSIEIRKPEEELVVVPGLGKVTAVRSPFVQRGHASSEVRTRTVLRITFDQPRSLSEALDLCLGVELLFGFLTGFRPKFPMFHLWGAGTEGNERVPQDAELELGGVSFRPDKLPHFLERMHMKGRDAAGLKEVLEVYAANQFDIPTRIAAVQIGRWFGGTLNERFASVMPVLEELLKARFKSGEETSYLASEQAFFDYVDAAEDPAVGEFARKHLEVKNKKSPGLPTLITRAIKVLNDAGFEFGADLPKRINKRRASMFHSSPLIDGGDVQAFYEEASSATAMLTLLTLRDLGVDLAPLSGHYPSMRDLSQFMKHPNSSGPIRET